MEDPYDPYEYAAADVKRAYHDGLSHGYTEGLMDTVPVVARDFVSAMIPVALHPDRALLLTEVVPQAFELAAQFVAESERRRAQDRSPARRGGVATTGGSDPGGDGGGG